MTKLNELKKDHSPHPIKGRNYPIIAIIGSDGSGKSTVSEVLLEEMSLYHPTAICHLGKQAGNLGRAIEKIPLIGKIITKRCQKEAKSRKTEKKSSILAILIGFCFSLRRVLRFKRMRKKHAKGFAILTDRYPQNMIPGPMDGPILSDMPIKGRFPHFLMRLERKLYENMVHFKPDLIIRLNVDLETAIERKPDHNPEKLERKISDLAKLHFPDIPVLEIDATQPLEEVVHTAKAAIRKILSIYPLARQGALISLVGCDGSGKSSLSADLVQSLSSKRPTQYHYLGLGSGDLGRWIGTWPFIGAFLERKLTSKAKKTRTKGEKIPGFLTALVVFIFSLIRYRRFLNAKKAVHDGYLVITDRYPQNEIAGQCDGPGLSAAKTNNPFIKILSLIEKKLYRKMASYRPNLIFSLEIDAETAHQRKPDHDINSLKTKIAIMPQLHFNHAEKISINATQAYLEVREEILSHLQQKGIFLKVKP